MRGIGGPTAAIERKERAIIVGVHAACARQHQLVDEFLTVLAIAVPRLEVVLAIYMQVAHAAVLRLAVGIQSDLRNARRCVTEARPMKVWMAFIGILMLTKITVHDRHGERR